MHDWNLLTSLCSWVQHLTPSFSLLHSIQLFGLRAQL